MYTRMTRFEFDKNQTDEMVARLDDIGEKLKAIDGMIETFVVWDSEGVGHSIAMYKDQSAAEAASGSIQSIWGGLMGLLTGPPVPSEFANGWHVKN